MSATAVVTQNPIFSRLFSAFLTTEYYLVRVSNTHPELVGQLLSEVVEPEDRARTPLLHGRRKTRLIRRRDLLDEDHGGVATV